MTLTWQSKTYVISYMNDQYNQNVSNSMGIGVLRAVADVLVLPFLIDLNAKQLLIYNKRQAHDTIRVQSVTRMN